MSTHKRQSLSLLCPQNRKTPRQVFGAFSLAGRYTELRYKSGNGGRSMRRFLGWLVLAAALAAACLYTWCLGVPAFRGEAGPCSVTVTCPGGAAPTVYSYDLVGDGFCRTLHISYEICRRENTEFWKTAWSGAACKFPWKTLLPTSGPTTPGPQHRPDDVLCNLCKKKHIFL